MRCRYYKTKMVEDVPVGHCWLWGYPVKWELDCKKCITDAIARERAWQEVEHHIKGRLFAEIPKKFIRNISECPARGDVLEGVTKTEQCCGGMTKEVPMHECKTRKLPVSDKECLECMNGK